MPTYLKGDASLVLSQPLLFQLPVTWESLGEPAPADRKDTDWDGTPVRRACPDLTASSCHICRQPRGKPVRQDYCSSQRQILFFPFLQHEGVRTWILPPVHWLQMELGSRKIQSKRTGMFHKNKENKRVWERHIDPVAELEMKTSETASVAPAAPEVRHRTRQCDQRKTQLAANNGCLCMILTSEYLHPFIYVCISNFQQWAFITFILEKREKTYSKE